MFFSSNFNRTFTDKLIFVCRLLSLKLKLIQALFFARFCSFLAKWLLFLANGYYSLLNLLNCLENSEKVKIASQSVVICQVTVWVHISCLNTTYMAFIDKSIIWFMIWKFTQGSKFDINCPYKSIYSMINVDSTLEWLFETHTNVSKRYKAFRRSKNK